MIEPGNNKQVLAPSQLVHFPPYTMRTMDSSRKFHIIVLHEYSPGLHAYLKSYEADLSGEENLVEHLEYTTLTYVKSLPDFQEFKLLRVARPKVYLVSVLCDAQITGKFAWG